MSWSPRSSLSPVVLAVRSGRSRAAHASTILAVGRGVVIAPGHTELSLGINVAAPVYRLERCEREVRAINAWVGIGHRVRVENPLRDVATEVGLAPSPITLGRLAADALGRGAAHGSGVVVRVGGIDGDGVGRGRPRIGPLLGGAGPGVERFRLRRE